MAAKKKAAPRKEAPRAGTISVSLAARRAPYHSHDACRYAAGIVSYLTVTELESGVHVTTNLCHAHGVESTTLRLTAETAKTLHRRLSEYLDAQSFSASEWQRQDELAVAT